MNKYPHIIYTDNINIVNYPCQDLHHNGFELIAILDKDNLDLVNFVEDKKKSGYEVKLIHSDMENDQKVHIWVKKID